MFWLTVWFIERRPSLNAILTHSWFFDGPFPPLIPVSSNDVQPSFRHLLTTQSRANYKAVCQKAKIGSQASINTDATKPRTALGPSIMQQERDFKNAVQPDSPISALLKYVPNAARPVPSY
jgi:polo-like kinase 1